MLNVVSLSDAERIIKERLICEFKTESVSVDEASGRVAANDIISRENIPAFNRSTVDGYAVRASDTYGAGESIPSLLKIKKEILMGDKAEFSIEGGECARISTGGMLPDGADGVVMVENTDNENDEICFVFKAVSPFENVTRLGDDVRENEIVIRKHTKLLPSHIGVLSAIGIERVEVVKKPRVGIISTGDEIVEIGRTPQTGQIRDVNSHLLAAMTESWGCEAECLGIVKDRFEELHSAVLKAAGEFDVVLVSGGSSAGARDMTVDVISRSGEVFAHGIAMKPGKPTIIGKIGKAAVFGLPGHPAAAFFVTLELVRPLLNALSLNNYTETIRECRLKSNVSSNHGREEFLCVKIENGFAVPVYSKSGIVSMLAKSDGYIRIDRNLEGLKAGDTVEVHLF